MNQTFDQARVRAFRLLTGVSLGIGVLACNSSSATGDDGGTDASGPAQVVYVTNSVAGGQRLIDSLVIDSASGKWSQSQCGPVSATTATCSDFRTVTGTMEAFMRDPLFERARRTDFAMLQREYRRSGQVPPDNTTSVLRIVQGVRKRELLWESGVDLPPALQSFLCRLQQARGALILCAE